MSEPAKAPKGRTPQWLSKGRGLIISMGEVNRKQKQILCTQVSIFSGILNILICRVHLLRHFGNGKSFATPFLRLLLFFFSQLAGGINVTCITAEGTKDGYAARL